MPLPPPLPVPSFQNAVQQRWSWQLAASPEALWPLVADTNRVNALAGLPAVALTEERVAAGQVRRVASAKFYGRVLRWEEHPFEWIEPARFGVLRVFYDGPVLAYRSTCVLEASGGGTLLTQTVEAVPRNALMAPVARLTVGRSRAGLERAYRQMDAYLVAAAPHPMEPAVGKPLPPKIAELARGLGSTGQPWELIAHLTRLVADADASELQSMRPFVLADRWGFARRTTLGLFLAASSVGLLERRWSHLCPGCRGPKNAASSLAELVQEAYCASCDQAFVGRFDATIELSFRPHPALREISDTMFCVGGPRLTPHVVVQVELQPGETRELSVKLDPGPYRMRTDRDWPAIALQVLAPEDAAAQPLTLHFAADSLPSEEQAVAGAPVALRLTNADSVALRVMLEHVGWNEEAVTAALVTALPEFRTLCPNEMPKEHTFEIGLMAFLACHLPTATLTEGLDVLARHGGAVWHGDGEEILVVFYDPLEAVEAALALQAEGLADGQAIAVGACEVASDQGQMIYTGAAVERARELAGTAGVGELVLPEELAADVAVVMLLGGREDVQIVETDETPGCVTLATV